MKQCIDCKQEKDEAEFNYHKSTADHLTQRCKGCISAYNKAYRAANKERIKEKDRQYAAEHAEEARQRTKQWIEDNREQKRELDKRHYSRTKEHQMARYRERYINEGLGDIVRERARRWRQENPGRVAATLARRRASIKQATPGWAQLKEIEQMYIKAATMTRDEGIEYQVDHKVPLESPIVCGLHVLENLQIITADENNRKKCKLDESIL